VATNRKKDNTLKYIFVAGAPGSKWSSVVKNIYYSPSIDQSDYSDERTYYHDASGSMQLMHLGAYFDPGMEFGDLLADMQKYTKEELEKEFDRPFSGEGVRIIKSHVFANNIDFIKKTWPDSPIVLVHRDNDSCLGWWVKCGHFDITYPKYDIYYKDLRTMASIIEKQNKDIQDASDKHKPFRVYNNSRLALILGIAQPPDEYKQSYIENDIEVSVIC
jgi:hypothetical protein